MPESGVVRIRFLPDQPGPAYFVGHAMQHLGWSQARYDHGADIGFKWCDRTRIRNGHALRSLERRLPVLNGGCSDIGKRRVARVFEEVFGYPLSLDPRSHVGPCVQKSSSNHTHDGAILRCPIPRVRRGFTYSRLIDNSADATGRIHTDRVFDLRTPYFRGGGIPYVLVKAKRIEARFASGGGSAPADGAAYALLEPDRVFDADERRRLARFCAAMGLDVCELDVLRDRVDGRIYVVDANWTPSQPTRTLSKADRRTAIGLWAAALERCVEASLAARRRRRRWNGSGRSWFGRPGPRA